jgi:hypothetical protein
MKPVNWVKLPPLLYTTNEGRRVYPIRLFIEKLYLVEIHIDPHYEEAHSSYMTDKIIYNLVFELEKEERWEPEDRDGGWTYYSAVPLYLDDWRAYELVWCLKDGANFLGVRSCYRRSKYDKKELKIKLKSKNEPNK